MKFPFFMIAALAIAANSIAQDRVKVGDVVDLEERIMIKKMNDELNKPDPNAPPAPVPMMAAPKPPKISYPTETLAVYGTSATGYQGQLSMGGRTYVVRAGTPVQEYIVDSVTPFGVELKKTVAPTKRRGKHRPTMPTQQMMFVPLVAH